MVISNLTGERFGRLVVQGISAVKDRNGRKWDCLCDCGETTVATSYMLTHGDKRSCGCLQREMRYTHGMTKDPIYRSWCSMMGRCNNFKDPAYKRYGGRGIKVCERWNGPEGFTNFFSDMGERPEETSIDRINNDGNYEPDNCRWATHGEQSRNYSRNVMVSILGERYCLKDICKKWEISEGTVRSRRKGGWPIACSLMIPADAHQFTDLRERISCGAQNKKMLNALKF